MRYTDSKGITYGLIYITATITNLDSIPADLQLSLPKAYDFPEGYGDKMFHLYIWPDMDSNDIHDMALENGAFDQGSDSKDKTYSEHDLIINPGQKRIITIGTMFPSPGSKCSATPYELFSFQNPNEYSECEWSEPDSNSNVLVRRLALKLGFCTVGGDYEACMYMACGMES